MKGAFNQKPHLLVIAKLYAAFVVEPAFLENLLWQFILTQSSNGKTGESEIRRCMVTRH